MTPLAALIRLGAPALVAASLVVPAQEVLRHRAGAPDLTARPLPPVPRAVSAPAPDLAALTRLAPFGAPPLPEMVVPPAAAPVDLVLQGVMVAADPARSAAFLRAEGQTNRVTVGAEIAPGITLAAAATDHVTLSVDGVEQVLRFPDASAIPIAAAEPEAAALAPGLLAGMVPAPPRETPARTAPRTVEDHVDLWRDRIRRNPQQVLDVIGLVPGPGGYTIAADHARGIRRIGLETGDRVLRVNGEAVGDPARDRALYDRVAASDLVTLEVAREGESFTMSFPLR